MHSRKRRNLLLYNIDCSKMPHKVHYVYLEVNFDAISRSHKRLSLIMPSGKLPNSRARVGDRSPGVVSPCSQAESTVCSRNHARLFTAVSSQGGRLPVQVTCSQAGDAARGFLLSELIPLVTKRGTRSTNAHALWTSSAHGIWTDSPRDIRFPWLRNAALSHPPRA